MARQEYVYLIRSGESPVYKIGRSCQPKKRLKQLQTGHPVKLFLVHIIRCEEFPARKVEKFLHSRFMYHRSRQNGEWFNLTEDIVRWLAEFQTDRAMFLTG